MSVAKTSQKVGVTVQCVSRASSAYLLSRSLMASWCAGKCDAEFAMNPSTSSSEATRSHSLISSSRQFRISARVLAMRAGYSPNDPKLSHGVAWRGSCVVELSEGIRTTDEGGSK